jgi:hypothetical protein
MAAESKISEMNYIVEYSSVYSSEQAAIKTTIVNLIPNRARKYPLSALTNLRE